MSIFNGQHQFVSIPKEKVFRSEKLLAAVRRLPCMVCRVPHSTEAAHSNQLRFGKGRSLRASDAAIMALCKMRPGTPGCHHTHDQLGTRNKAEQWAFEYKYITLTLMLLVQRDQLVWAERPSDLFWASLPPPYTDAGHAGWEYSALILVGAIESGKLKVSN